MPIELHATTCAICETEGNATELYPARFTERDFNPAVFSARRSPDRVHYRIVRCDTCGLVRSDPVGDGASLEQLYSKSEFDYVDEVANLKRTYSRLFRRVLRNRSAMSSLLEIGCGNGFFLEEAVRIGFREVRGIEPSEDAVNAARADIRDRIVCDVMRPGLFDADHFDVVCLFQVFDHIPDPGSLLVECLRVLKPGGLLLAANHDVGALSAKLLGERSPIIDIEHTYLYDRKTMPRIARRHAFEVLECGSFKNTYSLAYLAQLLPIPAGVKRRLTPSAALRTIRLTVGLGNLFLVARKPIQ